MPTKKYKPTSPGRRFMSVSSFEGVTKSAPQRQLVEHLKKHSGRNASGRITVRHQGGGHKKTYRLIDFKRQKDGVPGKVQTIEYDPNRSARIALIVYADGDKRYILSPHGLSVGDVVSSGDAAEIRPGCALPITNIPLGTTIHNLEVKLGRGGQLVRSAGTAAQLLAKEGVYAQVRMPSGEVRLIDVRCRATIGQVGNVDHENEVVGAGRPLAGAARWRRPDPRLRGTGSRRPVRWSGPLRQGRVRGASSHGRLHGGETGRGWRAAAGDP